MMDFNEYQQEAVRTANPAGTKVMKLANWTIGLAGEAGETADVMKKSLFHGHELDKDEIKKELGDVLWYLANLAEELHISLQDVAMLNVHKLRKRYPKGFTKEDSLERRDQEIEQKGT